MKSNKVHALILGVLFVFTLFFYSLSSKTVHAQSEDERLEKLAKEVEQYEIELERLKNQASTLSNQIAQFDAQIRLTTLKITQTEEKIFLLGGRIDRLENSLDALTEAFTSRATQTYTMTRLNQPILQLVLSPNLSKAVSSYHYLKRIQESDRDLLVRLEDAQGNYKEEKVDQEVLQLELEDQKSVLGAQKSAKANLLEVTRNDEKKYQELLAQAKAEFEAIQAIIAGKGDEELVGSVSTGETIASVIQGPSCNSSGGHLHFIVNVGGVTQSPFSYLKSGIAFENCSGSSCGASDADPFNPSGSWDWPISGPIKYSQGYGSTWAVRNTWVGRIYSFHNGIDINNGTNPTVRAVVSGDLYRGSYSGSGGCRLRYVRVDHSDSNIDTFYLHINY